MQRRAVLTAFGATLLAGCSLGREPTVRPPQNVSLNESLPPTYVDSPPSKRRVIRRPAERRDLVTAYTGRWAYRSSLRYWSEDGSIADLEPGNGVFFTAELVVRNRGGETARPPSAEEFALVCERRVFPPLSSFPNDIDWQDITFQNGDVGLIEPTFVTPGEYYRSLPPDSVSAVTRRLVMLFDTFAPPDEVYLRWDSPAPVEGFDEPVFLPLDTSES